MNFGKISRFKKVTIISSCLFVILITCCTAFAFSIAHGDELANTNDEYNLLDNTNNLEYPSIKYSYERRSPAMNNQGYFDIPVYAVPYYNTDIGLFSEAKKITDVSVSITRAGTAIIKVKIHDIKVEGYEKSDNYSIGSINKQTNIITPRWSSISTFTLTGCADRMIVDSSGHWVNCLQYEAGGSATNTDMVSYVPKISQTWSDEFSSYAVFIGVKPIGNVVTFTDDHKYSPYGAERVTLDGEKLSESNIPTMRSSNTWTHDEEFYGWIDDKGTIYQNEDLLNIEVDKNLSFRAQWKTDESPNISKFEKTTKWNNDERTVGSVEIESVSNGNRPAKTPKVLFIGGTLCNTHGLHGGVIRDSIESVRQVADVDYFLYGSMGTTHRKEFCGSLTAGGNESVDYFSIMSNIESGFHLCMNQVINCLNTQLKSNEYDNIVFMFDGTVIAEEYGSNKDPLVSESDLSNVRDKLKPYYKDNKVIWLHPDYVKFNGADKYPAYQGRQHYLNPNYHKGTEGTTGSWHTLSSTDKVKYPALASILCPSAFENSEQMNLINHVKPIPKTALSLEHDLLYDDAQACANGIVSCVTEPYRYTLEFNDQIRVDQGCAIKDKYFMVQDDNGKYVKYTGEKQSIDISTDGKVNAQFKDEVFTSKVKLVIEFYSSNGTDEFKNISTTGDPTYGDATMKLTTIPPGGTSEEPIVVVPDPASIQEPLQWPVNISYHVENNADPKGHNPYDTCNLIFNSSQVKDAVEVGADNINLMTNDDYDYVKGATAVPGEGWKFTFWTDDNDPDHKPIEDLPDKDKPEYYKGPQNSEDRNQQGSFTANFVYEGDVSVEKTVDKSSVVGGDSITYTLNIENKSSSTASGVFVQDKLYDYLSIISSVEIIQGSGTWSKDTGIASWTIDIGAHEKTELKFKISIKSDITSDICKKLGDKINNIATFTYSGDIATSNLVSTTIAPKKYKLTIHYQDTNKISLAEDYANEIACGDSYSVASPKVEGYTPKTETVSGNMPAQDKEITVVYDINKHTLIINYLKVGTGIPVADQFKNTLSYNESFKQKSPTVSGFVLVNKDQETVSGTMPDENVTINVYYNQVFVVSYAWGTNSQTPKSGISGKDIDPPSADEVVAGTKYTSKQPTTYYAGYSFDGWYTNIECTVPFSDDTVVNNSINLYGKWTLEAVITKTVDKSTADSGDTLEYSLTVKNPTENNITTAIVVDTLPAGVELIVETSPDYTYDPVSRKMLWENVKVPSKNAEESGTTELKFNVKIQTVKVAKLTIENKAVLSLYGNEAPEAKATTVVNPVVTSINVHKVWTDGFEKHKGEGDVVEAALYQKINDEEEKIVPIEGSTTNKVKLNDGNNWKYQYENLKVYADDGTKILYTVKEFDKNNNPVEDGGQYESKYTAYYSYTDVLEVRTDACITNVYNLSPSDLRIEKSADKKTACAGEQITYTLKVYNDSSANMQKVLVHDALPDNLIYFSSDPECYFDETDIDHHVPRWSIDVLKAGTCSTITLVAQVPDDVTSHTYYNVANIDSYAEYHEDKIAPESVKNPPIPEIKNISLSKTIIKDQQHYVVANIEKGNATTFCYHIAINDTDKFLNTALIDIFPIGLSPNEKDPDYKSDEWKQLEDKRWQCTKTIGELNKDTIKTINISVVADSAINETKRLISDASISAEVEIQKNSFYEQEKINFKLNNSANDTVSTKSNQTEVLVTIPTEKDPIPSPPFVVDVQEVKVTKIWSDDTVQHTNDQVGIALYQNEVEIDNKVLNTSNNWTFTWTNLPRISDTGAEFKYKVVETSNKDGYASTYEPENGIVNDSGNVIVTNTKIYDSPAEVITAQTSDSSLVTWLILVCIIVSAFFVLQIPRTRTKNCI